MGEGGAKEKRCGWELVAYLASCVGDGTGDGTRHHKAELKYYNYVEI